MPFADPDRAERRAFLTAAVVVVLACAWFVLRPLAAPLVLAALTAVVAQPLHRRVERLMPHRRVLTACATLVLLTAVVGLPAFGLGMLFLVQAREVMAQLLGEESSRSRLVDQAQLYVQWGADFASAILGRAVDVEALWRDTVEKLGRAAGSRIPDLLGLVGKLAFGALLFYLVLFVMFLRGREAVATLIELLPIGESRSRRVLSRLESTVQGVFLGSLATAVLQGTLATLAFWLLGFDNQVVWGVLVAAAGLVPLVGTGLILVPATVFMFLTDHTGTGIARLVVTAVVGTVDPLGPPLVIHERAAVHPLLVFIGLFGGLSTLGGMGLLYGPLLVACLTEMVRIYRAEFSRSDSPREELPATPAAPKPAGTELEE